uniref:Pyridoxamine kinase/Phosphomethylpyrimidine kinase domain-containing protein n=1 Tax=Globisporangium ultimum (strain ATCC 200006 / CBS 805.95 / DAOM BR144) TaxID=431595 RepID=K3WRS6_GLOUD
MDSTLAQKLWAQAQPRAFQSLYHPFVASLAAGTLARADFEAFLLQDAYYLLGFAKAFAHAVIKAKRTEHALAVIRLMQGIEHELSTHTAFLHAYGIDTFKIVDASAAPATKKYVEFLLTTAETRGSVAEILTAMTPCMRLYAFLGQGIRKALGGMPDAQHPYHRWIGSYGTDEFNDSAEITENLLNEVAETEGISFETLAPLYNTAMELELCFFEAFFPLARAHASASACFPAVTYPMKVLLKVEEDSDPGVVSKGLDVVVALGKGEYEIHVAMDESTNQVALSVCALDDYEVVDLERKHPLLRAIVGSNPSSVVYDATQHHVVASSKIEFLAFFRLLSSRGEFTRYAHPLASLPASDEETDGSLLVNTTPPRVLIVAGSDSGGGAGVQADLKACTNLGVYSSSAITAITVQNTHGVYGIHAIPVNDIRDQITCVLDDIGADVIKTGMLFNEEIIDMVATVLQDRAIPLIVDPVMVATSGDRLLKEAAHESLVTKLFPLATLITPNIPEASVLLHGRPIATLEDMKAAARALAAFGSDFVLVKGGHLPPQPIADADDNGDGYVHDVLFDASTQAFHVIANQKLTTKNTHGTGCTLASAIAAEFAKTRDMVASVKAAIVYLHAVLAQSAYMRLGNGDSGPMLHVAQ